MLGIQGILALLLLAELGSCQEGADAVKRLRFRRPRPKLIDVENPDGDLVGSPVELILTDSEQGVDQDLVTAAQNSRQQTFTGRQQSGSSALDALIATAQREEPPAPQQLQIEEIPTRRPLDISGSRDRVRGQPPPRRKRPEGEKGQGRETPRRRPTAEREEPVATLERYSHKNDDGSFTFGYVGADGSFREETRGADCITRGKYGYIDPDGVKREYTYTSGLPCSTEEEGEDNSLDGGRDVVDTVDPKERFRQTQNEQLSGNQIPSVRQQQIAHRQRGVIREQGAQRAQSQAPQRRPSPPRQSQSSAVRAPQPAPLVTNNFANFGSQGTDAALQNLLTIAEPPVTPRAPVRSPSRAPVRIAQRPTQAPLAPAVPTFDFDSELDGFTLNRPAIKFEQNTAGALPSQTPVPISNQFQTQIAFNQATGVFQTSLQQSLPGGATIQTSNPAQPTGQAVTSRAPPTRAPPPPPSPTTRLPPTTLAFSPSSPRPQAILPAGTVSLRQPTFKPLNIPQDIAQVKTPTPAPPAPAPVETPRRAPTLPPVTVVTRPSPAPTPAPTLRPVTPKAVPQPPRAVPQAPGAPGNNGFFVFQPFNQKPASAPFRTPVNHNAFQIQPQSSPPKPPQRLAPQLVSQAGRPVTFPNVQQIVPVQAPRPQAPRPQAPRPAPQAPRPIPPPVAAPRPPTSPSRLPPGVFAVPAGSSIPQGAIRVNQQGHAINSQGRRIPEPSRPAPPQAARPRPQAGPAPSPPQLQFGFQPVPQGAPQRPGGGGRPQPFTAFSAGVPPQQLGVRAPQFQPGQLGIPPQLQGGPPQQPGQFQQFDSRFAPRPSAQGQFRPAQFQAGQQGFNGFNPQQLRGA